jgi:GH43 family beta-xylosidase
MKKFLVFRHLLLLISVIITSVSCSSCSGKNDPIDPPSHGNGNDTIRTYTNPLSSITNIGDPYVLKVNKMYYMYASSSDIGFKVWESPNLIDWTEKGLALDKTNASNQWGDGNFWAPEVKLYNNRYYMTYSAISSNGKMKIRIARSDNPLGPFINWSEPFFQSDNFSYIDADLFLDADKIYMYYVKDCSTNVINGKHISQIYVAELDSDLKGILGNPQLILSPDQTWEGIDQDWQWNEGPFVMKINNTFYLLYSANVFSSSDYSVGYATASSPMGSWTKSDANPVLKKDLAIKVSGPGHCCVTSSPDDKEFFIVYHTHTFFDAPSGNRNMCADRMVFENGGIKVIGPTRTPQALPSGILYRLNPK